MISSLDLVCNKFTIQWTNPFLYKADFTIFRHKCSNMSHIVHSFRHISSQSMAGFETAPTIYVCVKHASNKMYQQQLSLLRLTCQITQNFVLWFVKNLLIHQRTLGSCCTHKVMIGWDLNVWGSIIITKTKYLLLLVIYYFKSRIYFKKNQR